MAKKSMLLLKKRNRRTRKRGGANVETPYTTLSNFITIVINDNGELEEPGTRLFQLYYAALPTMTPDQKQEIMPRYQAALNNLLY
jgi:hypothetical protein